MSTKANRKAQYAAYVKSCINSGESIQTFVEFIEHMERIEAVGKYVWLDAGDEENISVLMQSVSNDVMHERIRQNAKWGKQRHDAGKWLAILVEEVGEAAQAAMPVMGLTTTKETDADDLYEELAHVSAVAKAWMEQIKEERENNRVE